MKALAFVLIFCSVFGANLRQGRQSLIVPTEEEAQIFLRGFFQHSEELELELLELLYPGRANEVNDELNVCQKQIVEAAPNMMEQMTNDIETLDDACLNGGGAGAVTQYTMVLIFSLVYSCPSLPVDLVGDIERLLATPLDFSQYKPKEDIQDLADMASLFGNDYGDELEQSSREFLDALPENITGITEYPPEAVKAASRLAILMAEGAESMDRHAQSIGMTTGETVGVDEEVTEKAKARREMKKVLHENINKEVISGNWSVDLFTSVTLPDPSFALDDDVDFAKKLQLIESAAKIAEDICSYLIPFTKFVEERSSGSIYS